MEKVKFATAINCIDGRAQGPVISFLKQKFAVDYVDMITEPGPDKILAEGQDSAAVVSIKKRVQISLEKHNSAAILIAGHFDCAGNPVDRSEHLRQIRIAAKKIQEWGFGVPVLGAWLDEKFQVESL